MAAYFRTDAEIAANKFDDDRQKYIDNFMQYTQNAKSVLTALTGLKAAIQADTSDHTQAEKDAAKAVLDEMIVAGRAYAKSELGIV
jgi:hypothetical protein